MKKLLLTLVAILTATIIKAEDISFAWNGSEAWTKDTGAATLSLTQQGIRFFADKENGVTAPTVNDSKKDVRVYAKGKLTVSVSAESVLNKMVFTLSKNGLDRWAEITPNVGEITLDKENGTVTWTGDASTVELTVGEKAIHGVDPSKAGQFCFNSPVAITGTIKGEIEEPEQPAPKIYTFTKVTAADQLTADSKFVLGANVEGVIKVAQNLPTSSAFGYLSTVDAEEQEGKITTNTIACTFMYKGTNLIDSYGRMLHMSGDYNSFNVSENPEEAIDWTITVAENGEVTIMNDDKAKFVQFDTKFQSYGVYAEETGVKPCIYVLTDSIEDITPPEEPTIQRITVSEFLAKADTKTVFEITGVVTGLKDATYGNFTLEQDGASIYIYGVLDKDGQPKNWAALGVVEGDSIVLQGVYTEYNGNPQIAKAQYISHKSMGEDVVDISNTPETAYDINKVRELVEAGKGLSTKVYVKGIISGIKNVDTGDYGNAEYYISNDGTETDQLLVFRGLYLNGEKFTSANQIKVGDELIIYGLLDSFNGEAQIAKSYIHSINNGDGISNIPSANEQELVIYNLAGLRVQRMQKGIYIVNGKKILK